MSPLILTTLIVPELTLRIDLSSLKKYRSINGIGEDDDEV